MIEYFQGKESIHCFDENMFWCLERKIFAQYWDFLHVILKIFSCGDLVCCRLPSHKDFFSFFFRVSLMFM